MTFRNEGNLIVNLRIKVPPAATDRLAASRESKAAWPEQVMILAKLEGVTPEESEEVVGRIRANNPGADIRGEWTGTRQIGSAYVQRVSSWEPFPGKVPPPAPRAADLNWTAPDAKVPYGATVSFERLSLMDYFMYRGKRWVKNGIDTAYRPGKAATTRMIHPSEMVRKCR